VNQLVESFNSFRHAPFRDSVSLLSMRRV